MATIHLVDGEKGGIGKSWFALCMAYYLNQIQIPYALFDTDPKNADVAKVYGGRQDITFKASDKQMAIRSKKASEVDRIYDSAVEKGLALVNLPANVHDQVYYWLNSNGLLQGMSGSLQNLGIDVGEMEVDIEVVKWFLSNGSHACMKLFYNSLDAYEGKVAHVFVRNLGVGLDWSGVDDSEQFAEYKDLYKFHDIEFPGLQAAARDFIEANSIAFSQALAKDSPLPVLDKQRLVKFLGQTIEQMMVTGLMPNIETSKSKSKKLKQDCAEVYEEAS